MGLSANKSGFVCFGATLDDYGSYLGISGQACFLVYRGGLSWQGDSTMSQEDSTVHVRIKHIRLKGLH